MTIPRISTRGYYDLSNGKTLKKNLYYLYPKKSLDALTKTKELTIMIHGLRNNKADAVNKFEIAKKRLSQIGYLHPIIGFSYDSNTRGAHLKRTELHALRVGQKIAQKNGRNLGEFILDLKKINPLVRIRLIGHSLGTQVILSTVDFLSKNSSRFGILESVHFLGASITYEDILKNKKNFQRIVNKKIINYYSPFDEVLQYAHETHSVQNPLGLVGSTGRKIPKYIDKKVKPDNHRFASYAKTIVHFP